MKKTLMTLLAATIAGCSGSPDWKDPEMNQKPIVLEEQVKDAPQKEAPKKEKPAYEKESTDYNTVEIEVAYQFGDKTAARSFDGYAMKTEKNGRELNDYEKMQLA